MVFENHMPKFKNSNAKLEQIFTFYVNQHYGITNSQRLRKLGILSPLEDPLRPRGSKWCLWGGQKTLLQRLLAQNQCKRICKETTIRKKVAKLNLIFVMFYFMQTTPEMVWYCKICHKHHTFSCVAFCFFATRNVECAMKSLPSFIGKKHLRLRILSSTFFLGDYDTAVRFYAILISFWLQLWSKDHSV